MIKSAREIMTKETVTSFPDMVMTKVSEIFDNNSFHHLPVIDDNGICVGVISKSDYYQLQNHFTKKNIGNAKLSNKMFFRSLLASEVMTPNPKTIDVNDPISKAVEMFLENKYHSLVVTKENKYQGIITPYDILKQLKY